MRRALGAVVLVSAMGAAACAELPEPDLGLVPATSTTVVAAVDDDPTAETTPSDVVVAPVGVFSPPRPTGYVPTVLLATDVGIFVADDPELIGPLPTPVGELVADRVVDDYFGGLVVQTANGEIRSYRNDESEGSLVDATGGRLLDVGFLDATLAGQAFVAFDDVQVDQIRLADGDRSLFTRLEPGEVIVDLSAGEGLYAVIVANENCGALLFFDSTGETVDVGGPGLPACEVSRRPAFGSVALGPDGQTVAFTMIRYRSDGVPASTTAIVQELGTDVELYSAQIGGGGDRIAHLDFDGQRLAFVRTGTEGQFAVVVDSSGDGEEEVVLLLEGSTATAVSFARQPLLVGG